MNVLVLAMVPQDGARRYQTEQTSSATYIRTKLISCSAPLFSNRVRQDIIPRSAPVEASSFVVDSCQINLVQMVGILRYAVVGITATTVSIQFLVVYRVARSLTL